MDNLLDTTTLTVVDAAIELAISLSIVFIWRTRKTYPGFGAWVLANVALLVGFILLILRGVVSDFLSIVIANVIIYASYLFLLEGIRWFRGRKGISWVTYIGLPISLILFFVFTFIDDNLKARMLSVSVLYGSACFFIAFAIMYKIPQALRATHRFIGGIFLFAGVVMVIRFFLVLNEPDQGEFFQISMILAIFTFLVPIPLNIIWTYGLVLLNHERLEQEWKDMQLELRRLAMNDSLTGTYNNRYFYEIGKTEVAQARRYQHALSVIFYDIDNFKNINDTCGHPTGDRVLKSLVLITQKCLREADILGRLGGDEFAIILPQTDLDRAKSVAERLRQMIETAEVPEEAGEPLVHYTVSLGVSEVHLGEETIEQAIKRADTALYVAKRHNRNMVVADNDLTLKQPIIRKESILD